MGRQSSFILWLLLLSLAPVSAEEPVSFGDGTLKALVEETLWISDPTPSDMLGFTFLDATDKGIQSLKGLEYAQNLLTLWLGDNQFISDISPLAPLTDLTMLVLNQNRIHDISPLAGMTRMRDLDVHHNQISDISALAGLTSLRRLALRENPIRDISVLAELVNLEDLILSFTEVNDISPLLGLRSLKRLDVRDCPLDRSTRDAYIARIVANNPGLYLLYDPQDWHTVTITSSEGGSVINPGEGELTFAHGETILLIARADPGFSFVNWSGTFRGTQNPMSVTVTDDCEIHADFFDLSHTRFVDDTGPYDLGPGDPTMSDPREDGTPEHPFDTIQEAINTSNMGMAVYVRPGTYRESISPFGRNIRLIGLSPEDPNAEPYPVITGDGKLPAVRFTMGESSFCQLTGFVITQGEGDFAGALYCDASSPTIANCLIAGNRSTGSAGSAVCCVDSRAVLVNCTIADNVAGPQGAGIYLVDSDVTIKNSIIWNNGPTEILLAGYSAPRITYSNVAGGWSDTGTITTDPLFARAGYWAAPHDPGLVLGPYDPAAVWRPGDYHLQSQAGRRRVDGRGWYRDSATSPCIDAGAPESPVADEPAPNGGRINLGAYGGTPQAAKSPTAP